MWSAAIFIRLSASRGARPMSITCVSPVSRGLTGRCGRSRKSGTGEDTNRPGGHRRASQLVCGGMRQLWSSEPGRGEVLHELRDAAGAALSVVLHALQGGPEVLHGMRGVADR